MNKEERLNLIFERRSIRKFEKANIEDEKIEKILKAAMAAPSAKNVQPWYFIVVTNKELLTKIAEIHPYAGMIKNAPAGIVVCGNKNEEFWVQDCSAAMQNILLAATALDLGSVWVGYYPLQERIDSLTEVLKLDKDYVPLGVCALGYPARRKDPDTKYLEDKVDYIN